IDKANGKYMAVMDADDISYLERIEKQVNYMEKNEDIDVLGTFYETMGLTKNRVVKSKVISSEEIKMSLIFSNVICNSTTLIRLEKIRNHNLRYNLECFVAQDYDLFVQILKVGKIEIFPEVLLKYRAGHSNITKNSKTK